MTDGSSYELAAADHLRGAGLAEVARNVRCRYGEIDLVMREGRVVVFAEVRYRRHTAFGGGAGSVDARKQARIAAAARWYLSQHPALAREACRFDVVAVTGDAPFQIDWLRDAFQPES